MVCVVFCKCIGQCWSCIKSASIVPLENECEEFVCMATLACSSFSEGMYLCLPALWLHASLCAGAAIPDVHLLNMSAEVSLLLFLLRKNKKAPANHKFCSSFYKPWSVHDFQLPGEQFLKSWSVVPALSTQLWPPLQPCQCFGSQVICSSVLLKGWLCELPLFVFPGREMRG